MAEQAAQGKDWRLSHLFLLKIFRPPPLCTPRGFSPLLPGAGKASGSPGQARHWLGWSCLGAVGSVGRAGPVEQHAGGFWYLAHSVTLLGLYKCTKNGPIREKTPGTASPRGSAGKRMRGGGFQPVFGRCHLLGRAAIPVKGPGGTPAAPGGGREGGGSRHKVGQDVGALARAPASWLLLSLVRTVQVMRVPGEETFTDFLRI